MIGSRIKATNQDYQEAYSNIGKIVSEQRVSEIYSKSLDRLRTWQKEYGDLVFGWSGGKDSEIIKSLCNDLDINTGFLGMNNLEYPEFLRWVSQNIDSDIDIVNTGIDYDYLLKHPNMLFSMNDSKKASKWYRLVQLDAQDSFIKSSGCNVVVLGRRKKDNNVTGKHGVFITKKKFNLSPIYDWGHEDVMAFCHYRKIDLAPFYSWHNGWKEGTHSWAARYFVDNDHDGWSQIAKIDIGIVWNASNYIDSAKKYLDEILS